MERAECRPQRVGRSGTEGTDGGKPSAPQQLKQVCGDRLVAEPHNTYNALEADGGEKKKNLTAVANMYKVTEGQLQVFAGHFRSGTTEAPGLQQLHST